MTELNDGATSVNSLSVDRADVTEQWLRRIKELLISGELAASSRFSSEPVLAEWLEVSRPLLRSALKPLSVMGLSGPGPDRDFGQKFKLLRSQASIFQ